MNKIIFYLAITIMFFGVVAMTYFGIIAWNSSESSAFRFAYISYAMIVFGGLCSKLILVLFKPFK